MREICQSGSMSGNRKQDQANRTEGTRRKPSHIPTGRLQSLRLFSTLLALSHVIRHRIGGRADTLDGSRRPQSACPRAPSGTPLKAPGTSRIGTDDSQHGQKCFRASLATSPRPEPFPPVQSSASTCSLEPKKSTRQAEHPHQE